MGLMGACRSNELHSMNIQHIEDLGSAMLITVPNTKTKITRKFTVTDAFYRIIKKYSDLRPSNVTCPSFFLNYHKGKCTCQRIGINKFAGMGKQIAQFLNLSNPEMYTGHAFRRSSATLLIDAGGDITALKRHGGWRSTAVAEGYIDQSMKNKMDTANKIFNSVTQSASTSSTSIQMQEATSFSDQIVNSNVNTVPSINLTNCSHFTINVISNDNDTSK